jgi:glutamate racemase
MPKNKIGVFDSGIGGLSVVKAVKTGLPDADVIFKNDAKHVPYGTRTPEQIYGFIKPIIQSFIDDGCLLIIIACNTVTTNLIHRLRDDFDIPFVGLEPMVKPAAAMTESGVIAVCATPLTLSSPRYKELKNEYAAGLKVLEPDCSDWAVMIESDSLDRKKITSTIEALCREGVDVIVLGCTHYHWIEEIINKIVAGKAVIIQPEVAVVAQTRRVLERLS